MADSLLSWLMKSGKDELAIADASDADFLPDPMDLCEEEDYEEKGEGGEIEEDESVAAEEEEEESKKQTLRNIHILTARLVLLTYGLRKGPKGPRFDPPQLVRPIEGIWKDTLSVGCLKLAILKNQARQWTQAPCVKPDDYALYLQGRLLRDTERFYDILSEQGQRAQMQPSCVSWGPTGPCVYLVLAPVSLPLPRYVHHFKIVVHRPFGTAQVKAPQMDVIEVNERIAIWDCTLGALRTRYGSGDRIWRPLGLCHELANDTALPAVFFGLNEDGTVHITA